MLGIGAVAYGASTRRQPTRGCAVKSRRRHCSCRASSHLSRRPTHWRPDDARTSSTDDGNTALGSELVRSPSGKWVLELVLLGLVDRHGVIGEQPPEALEGGPGFVRDGGDGCPSSLLMRGAAYTWCGADCLEAWPHEPLGAVVGQQDRPGDEHVLLARHPSSGAQRRGGSLNGAGTSRQSSVVFTWAVPLASRSRCHHDNAAEAQLLDNCRGSVDALSGTR